MHDATSRSDRELFDRIAEDYAEKDLRPSCRLAREHRLIQTCRTIGRELGDVLEVGAGAGFTARYLDGRYSSYTGLDYSSELIRYAEHYNAGPNRQFVCADINHFATDRRFDLILMIGVLHHIPDPGKALLRLRTLLTERGVIVVNEPQRGNPVISGLRWIRKRIDSKYSSEQVEFSEPEIQALFRQAGFEVVSFPQGLLSTPFAETKPLPEVPSRALARAATAVDMRLEPAFDVAGLRRLAWNVVVVGTPTDRA